MKDSEIFVLAKKKSASDQEAGGSSSQTLIYLALVACFFVLVVGLYNYLAKQKNLRLKQSITSQEEKIEEPANLKPGTASYFVEKYSIKEEASGGKDLVGFFSSQEEGSSEEKLIAVGTLVSWGKNEAKLQIQNDAISLRVPAEGVDGFVSDPETLAPVSKKLTSDEASYYLNKMVSVWLRIEGDSFVMEKIILNE